LYLKNGYNLNLNISENNINIQGAGKKPNIYLQNRIELEKDLSPKNFNHYYANLNEFNFLKLADSLYNLRMDLIQNGELENTKFQFIEESLAILDRSHKFINYPFSRLRIDPTYSPSQNFPETFKDIDINDERFYDIPHYSLIMFLKIVDAVTKDSIQPADPILGYLNFVLNGDLQVINRRLKEEIAFETVSLTMEKTDSLDKLFETYKNFSEDSIYLKEITNKYIKLKGVPKGSVAPNFSIQNANGDFISLEEFKGNVVYIDFWATWCKPCLSEINPSRELQNKLADYDIKFINIGIESKYNTWSNLISTKNIEGINLFANNEVEKKIKEDYFIQGLPRYVIIDKDGRIFDFSAKKPSDPKLEADLKSIL
jgi:thiol-disulfide isomerase/thioredoxin